MGRWGYLTTFVGESNLERRIVDQWVHHELRVMKKKLDNLVLHFLVATDYEIFSLLSLE